VFSRGKHGVVKDFLVYLQLLVEHRRARPGNPQHDVLTRLIQGEDNGERLTEKELLHNCIFLLNAGHETTTNLIGNGPGGAIGSSGEKPAADRTPRTDQDRGEEMLRFRKLEPSSATA